MFLRNVAARVLASGSRQTSPSAGIRLTPRLAHSRQPRNVSAAGSFYQKRFSWAGGAPADDAAEHRSMDADDVASDSGWDRSQRPVQRIISAKDTPPAAQLFIANIAYNVTEQDLEDNMADFGTIERVKILRDPDSGVSRGMGFVTFADIESATRAKDEMNGKAWEGRAINVQYARDKFDGRAKPLARSPTKTLFIGNLSYEMTDDDVNRMLQGVDGDPQIRLAANPRTGKLKGFCHLEFLDVQSAQEAFKKLQGREVFGRIIRLDYSDGVAIRRTPNVSRGGQEVDADIHGGGDASRRGEEWS